MNSALSIPRTFSCALDTFLGKTSSLFLPHLSNLAVRNEFTELLLSTWSRYYWDYCHFIFSRSRFRPEVSLSIIVKCNVNRLGKVTGIGIGNGRSRSTNRVFSRDVTAAMLVSLNKGTAAMLVSPTSLLGIELYSDANAFCCFALKTCSLIT